MSYFIYSPEALPNPEMMGKPRYTPDGEYIKFGGVALPLLKKGEWLELPDGYPTIRRRDWKDKHGEEVEVPIKRFQAVLKNPERGFAERGVVMLDHEPSEAEKKKIEEVSADLNLRFRKKCIEFFENQRQIAVAKQGTYEPTPYIDECYDLLGMAKPYSVEALKEQRAPGQMAAERISHAIAEGMKENARQVAEVMQDVLTRPKTGELPQARR
jgi:hypothetical protein